MDMNGHNMAQAQMQAMQQFESFVQNALMQAQQALGPQFRASAIFVHTTDRGRDLLIVPVGLSPFEIIAAVQARMKAAGVPEPANDAATAPKSEGPTPDLHVALINVVSAIRRAMPFITGPGADTAKRMLLDAIKADGVSETARQVVAGFLSSVPGNTDAHPGDIDKMLADAIDGRGEAALVFYNNVELGRPQ
jgi:hypothetical protein